VATTTSSHRNAAAGEEGDDGNTNDNDHCSAQCKIE
jgi:cysteine-rich repeat protein